MGGFARLLLQQRLVPVRNTSDFQQHPKSLLPPTSTDGQQSPSATASYHGRAPRVSESFMDSHDNSPGNARAVVHPVETIDSLTHDSCHVHGTLGAGLSNQVRSFEAQISLY